MAVTDITPLALVMNTASGDLADADAVVPTSATDGWNVLATGSGILARDYDGTRLLLKFVADGTARTVTIKAGDRPPSQRAGLGDLEIALAISDVKYIAVEAARFRQDDGKINIVTSNAAVKMGAFLMPRALGGGAA